MSKLAVKYNNELNSIPLRNFTVSELNIFLSICASIKEKGCDRVNYDFDKIRELANYESTSIERFVSDLKSTYSKLLATSYTLDDGDVIESFTLFNHYKIIRSEQTVDIEVNPNFKYILNDLNLGNFTRFELKEYTSINSTYSKALYMRLKQWKSKGKWEVSLDEFKRVLAIPESYKMGNIDQQILNPAMKDLAPYFDKLKIVKLDKRKKLSGRGRPVKFIRFTFKPQDDKKEWIENKNSSDKIAYGKHENVYLSDKEMDTIVYDWHMKYLIDEVSEWKLKNPSDYENRDFDLIKKFKENKENNNYFSK